MLNSFARERFKIEKIVPSVVEDFLIALYRIQLRERAG
jgi:hypothetical protein